MKKETAINHLFQHGRLTAEHEGKRQMLWGAITAVDEEGGEICFTNHHNQQVKYKFEDAKDFMPAKFIQRNVLQVELQLWMQGRGKVYLRELRSNILRKESMGLRIVTKMEYLMTFAKNVSLLYWEF
jgi:hypothetical protein